MLKDYLKRVIDKNSGRFVKLSGGKRERIPDDWFKVSVRGSSLEHWNIRDDDEVIVMPYNGDIESRPMVVVDSEFIDAPCNVLKFVSYFDIGYEKMKNISKDVVDNSRKDDRFLREIDYNSDIAGWKSFYKENAGMLYGLDPVYWHKLCMDYQSCLIKDERYKATDSTRIAIVCARYSFRFQWFLVPSEKILGVVRYVVDNSE